MKRLLILALFAVGCASTHSGTKGKFLNGEKNLNLQISARSVDQEKNSAFELFEVTVENLDNDWVRINNTKLLMSSDLNVVVGKDLQSWAEAIDVKQKKEAHNTGVAIAATQVIGTTSVILGGRSNPDLAKAGAVVMLGGLAWASAETLMAARNGAIGVKKVPESHIYESFAVPAKLSIRKWVLISKPVGTTINKLVMEFETVEGEKSVYEINM